MPRLQFLIPIITILLLINPAHTFTVSQAMQGRIEGNITDHPLNSDWLQDTRCFCQGNLQTKISQWEYYNVHTNTTFLLAFTENVRVYADGGKICQHYPHPDGKKGEDKLCIWPHDFWDSHFQPQDRIQFNGQMRGLGRVQGQGYDQSASLWARFGVCPDICREWMEWAHYGKDARVLGAKQVTYNDMDDMCDSCKKSE